MAVYDLHSIKNFFSSDQLSDRTLEKEEVLFREGDDVHSMFFVLEGEVRAETYLPDGKAIVFFRALNGAALSEEALFMPRYLFTAIASVPARVRSISKVDFFERFRNDPKFQEALFSCLAERYSESMMIRELLAIKSAEEPLYTWLHWQARGGEKVIDLSVIIGGIAPQLGLTKESVYRAFSKLEKHGKVKREDGKVTLL
ncbi:MAG: Crp/Fnr family transcriptional regulator [Opitutales bacterium]|nr:Crp/Fnr family transcriptional regulator [Opitutales bacterium]